MLVIILGGLRPMSFDSCLMGIVILITDSRPQAYGEVGYFSIGFTIGRQGLCSPRGARERTRWV
jgi:hypothetical protein